MPIPTDRGYVVVSDEGDGTKTVSVAAEIVSGEPAGVYAMHVGSPSVVIHPEVRLVEGRFNSFTPDVAEVFIDEAGTVHVAGVRSAHGARSQV